jgi:hypothetical protein
MRKTIYVAGYPKSGTTWLTRLLGDALDSPTGASVPEEDAAEPASGGHDRPGPYIVRKGHYRLVSCGGGGPVVPGPHQLCFACLIDPLFFIIRDPRDIAVSAAHFHNRPLEVVVDQMVRGELYNLPPWNEYVRDWVQSPEGGVVCLRYETLLRSPVFRLGFMLSVAGIEVERWRLRTAVVRQSFAQMKKRVEAHGDEMPGGKALNQKLLRKGKIGDWKGRLTGEPLRKLEAAFGETMKELGYEIGE